MHLPSGIPTLKRTSTSLKISKKRAARFILNDYHSRTPGCATQMVSTLGLDPLVIRRKSRRLCVFKQAILGHLSLPLDNLLHPVLRQSRHNHPDSYSIIAANKDCYKYSFVPRTIRDWNSLPHNIATIQTIGSFKSAVCDHLCASLGRD